MWPHLMFPDVFVYTAGSGWFIGVAHIGGGPVNMDPFRQQA